MPTPFSWIDAKGAFVTAQEKDDTLRASAGKKTQDSNTTMTFDEYYMCVALCGTIKYATNAPHTTHASCGKVAYPTHNAV